MYKRFSLKNKVAIITGACGLFGTEQIKALLESSCTVIGIDIDKYKIKSIKKKIPNKNLILLSCNLTNFSKANKLSKLILKKYKKIDILINNLSFDYKPNKKLNKKESLNSLSISTWKKHLDLGLTSAFICSQIFGKIMETKKKGVILNIGSDLSIIAPDQRLYSHLNSLKPVTYSVVKHGIVGLTKYLASYWSSKNIRVNCLSPGGIYNKQDKNFTKKIKKLIPLNRMAHKNEYNEVIQFLCSDASSYMTGQNIIIDGGRTII